MTNEEPQVATRQPDPADILAGRQLRQRRIMLGISQEALGQAVGVTFQQIQKYENARNRMATSRLQQFADALNVPPAYFFAEPELDMPEPDREALEMMAVYQRLNADTRATMRRLMRHLNSSTEK